MLGGAYSMSVPTLAPPQRNIVFFFHSFAFFCKAGSWDDVTTVK